MEQIKGFLDKELSLTEQAEVETHLRNNPDAAKMAKEFSAISNKIKSANIGVPYGKEALMQKLAQPQPAVRPVNKRLVWLRAALTSGIAALVLIGGFAAMSTKWGSADLAVSAVNPSVGGADSMAPQIAPSEMAPSGVSEASDPMGTNSSPAPTDETRSANPTAKKKSLDLGGRQDYQAERLESSKNTLKPDSDSTPSAPFGIYLERTGRIVVNVDNLTQTVDAATGIVKRMEGFVINSSIQNRSEYGQAVLDIKVPTQSFEATLSELGKLGEVATVESGSADITNEKVSNDAGVKYWADQEWQLVQQLKKAPSRQIQGIRYQLQQVRAQLEMLKAQKKSTDLRAQFSTISLTLNRGDVPSYDAGQPIPQSNNAWRSSTSALGAVGKAALTGLTWLFVFIPVWAPFAVAWFYIKRKSR